MICARKFAALAAIILTAPAAAESPAAPLLPMTMSEQGFAGEGWDAIVANIEGAQFILVGEDHGFADAPEITAALAQAARPFGFNYHVIEAGPASVEWAGDILRRDGVDGLATALEGRPLALPFLNLREDAQLAKDFMSAGGTLWGVDQEFVGSPMVIFEMLQQRARSAEAKAEIGALLAAEREAFASGNQGAIFLFTADSAAFERLNGFFPRDKKALAMISALRESAGIYQGFGRGDNFGSNTDRIALILRQFMGAYHGARERAPKAILKMGAIHTGRGTTFLNTFDVGSLTEGVAAANDMTVLRVVILPLAGMQTQIRPSADGAFAAVEYRAENVSALLTAAGISEADVPAEGYGVLALEPVRRALGQKGINALSGEVKFMLLGYDYLITTRSARAATPLAK